MRSPKCSPSQGRPRKEPHRVTLFGAPEQWAGWAAGEEGGPDQSAVQENGSEQRLHLLVTIP